ncbi:glycoside hydrolase family 43 protein [Pseudonocardia spinosispora]|uniref:glycoside hydrolase family 43 protein n=1 Tax=Pseudonocardia spinosispora TaxID=103441 RepID=UPI0003F9A5AA|nr:glycoside hydrolase family 43 protein [Pseudonocardia spinosispora]
MLPLSGTLWACAAKVGPALTAVVAAVAAPLVAPVIARDFPDPSILAVGKTYYAYSTSSVYGTTRRHVPVFQSTSASGPGAGKWADAGDALPQLPAWVAKDRTGASSVWAPAVVSRGPGSYLLYFTAQDAKLNVHCIGVATSSSPKGPFTPDGTTPLICRPQYRDSIDPMPFTDADGTRYLLYTSQNNGTTIWLQRLTPDGITPVGQRRALLTSDRPEEAQVVEAPTLVRRGGKYILFYSGNRYNSGRYFINYASASSLAGPFVKHPGTLLDGNTLNKKYANPGGQEVVLGGTHDYLVFHADIGRFQRGMFAAGLVWGKDGLPKVQLNGQSTPPSVQR